MMSADLYGVEGMIALIGESTYTKWAYWQEEGVAGFIAARDFSN
ncbi:hypothetical protein J6TS1_42410 [Siminovitchia terrae]|uniref:Uncharacterized protein n=1 Tax=Siminovitchia terrae TaxID=1914933 RepID=A0ABQ4L257_SIMTE|nr:hypothetical protein [Siminovitchia terrae]GIN98371.1 hypothetical protein J6TS1_42410 [Siminovitchia terrae]